MKATIQFPLRSLWIMCVGLVALLAVAVYTHQLFTISAEQRLARVEHDLNQLYATYRPIPYRWSGAPYSATPPQQVDKRLLGRAITELQSAEASLGRNAHTLQLLGRVHLLAGDYDQAVQNYHAAMIREPENPNLRLELSIGFALRAKKEGRALDYERALEAILGIEHPTGEPEILFDTALLFEEVPLPYQAVQRWQAAMVGNASDVWRKEAETRLANLEQFLRMRKKLIENLTDSPASYLAHADGTHGSLELVLEAATSNWLPVANSSPIEAKALTHLAHALEAQHQDRWLSDLLASFHRNTIALRALSESWNANSQGYHVRASHSAAVAENLFERTGNIAGVLRARVERAYALDRRQRPVECLKALNGLRSLAHARHYVWIEGQSWLEEISCQTERRAYEVIALRERAYEWITGTGYEVLRLRALSFLTEAYVSFGSRLSIWHRGRMGLKSFWEGAIPAGRGYTFYYTMASSARAAGDERTALALLGEGVYLLKNSPHYQLLALVLSYLAAWQTEAGLRDEASQTLQHMESIFRQRKRPEMEALWREAEISRAESEIASGQSKEALLRLKNLTKGLAHPFSSFSPGERRRLIPAFGNAYLSLGNLERAAGYYHLIISEVRQDLQSIRDSVQRENAEREIEPAWKGLTEINLRQHRPLLAYRIWEDYRDGGLHGYQTLDLPPDGTTVVIYAFLPQGLSAWLVQRTGVQQAWIDAKLAKSRLARFLTLVADSNSNLADVQDAGRRLYTILFRPFELHLSEQGSIIIDADGPLAGVPWSALVDERGQFLVSRFAITQGSGWAQFITQTKRAGVDLSKPLLFAEPALGPQLTDQYGPLPEASREARHIQHILPGSVLVAGKEASFDALARLGPGSTIFHFGGHGVSYGGFGALLLAPALGETAPAKIITANEIGELNLRRLQLVVLAACSSGAGQESGTVNLDSLVQGFLRAGVSRVVAARWSVNSPETADVMERFYDVLIQGQRPAEALRQAMFTVYTRSLTRHPYYWAGFQMFGAA